MADQDLLTTIRRVRGRWKLALVLRGAIICVAALVLLIAMSAIGFAELGLTARTVTAFRWAVGLAALTVFAIAVLLPAFRTVSDERVALYIEEREPALQSVLISAIENAGHPQNGLVRALVERAARQCRAIDFGQRIERQRLKRTGYVLAAAVLAAIIIVGAGPLPLRTSARALLLPMPAAQAAGIMSISALPGNDTIARGADIAVTAALHGFRSEEAVVVVRDSSGAWRRWPMSAGQKDGAFEAVLFDVRVNTDYYVESNEIRSPTYRIVVAEAPFVRSLALEFQYPAYTGMENKRVEEAGDIVAPRGTLVRVIATPSAAVNDGRLQLDDARTIRMEPAPAGALVATMRVLKDGLYHIELPALDGRYTSASAQYAITALEDKPPTVRVEKPGRDIKVSAVDEVFVSAAADDDYGVAALDLVYSVNGAPQQTRSLARPSGRAASLSGAHTFFLEELSLQPGDFVSYFVRARDNNAIDGARSATTDIYFVQIRPFSREYRAAEQAGMPGGGQGMEDPGALSEQQRQIIAATFNISRDRTTYTAQGFREALTTVELSQKRLREQVNTLLQRMQQRGVVQMDSIFTQIAELLPQAMRAMSDAEGQLQRQRPDDALPPEQRALQQLLRAEALYREVQVQMQQQAQSSGQGGTPPEDLADLFDLEREGLPNQYEQVQRSREEQAQRQVDETLERLRELARRQQQEAERQQQASRGQQPQQGGAGGTGSAQRRLADEAEEAARQLERLAREQSNPQLNDAARQLREAADAMRRASAQREGRGLADANEARRQLEEARRRLQQNQQQSLQQQVDEARQRADQLREQQRQIARDAESASGSQSMEQLRRLNEQKNQLGSGIAELESRLDRMSAEARGNNREASRQLQEAADQIRESRVRERIRGTQQNLQSRNREFNRAQEEQISRDLDRVAQQLGAASAAAGSRSAESQAQSQAERARQLAQGAQSMQDRAQNAQETPNTSSSARGGSRSGGSEGEARRQLRAEARQRAAEVQELQRQLRQQGGTSESLESALDALRALQSDGPYNDPEEVTRLLAKVTRGLQDFEFDLRRALEESDRQKLFLGAPGQVPSQYQKAVEEYYRALARRRSDR
jgi:hypothetical protein